MLGLQFVAGNAAATKLLAQPVQRETNTNTLRHKGRWGLITEFAYLRLWAKDAALDRLFADDRSVRTLQENPGDETALIESLLPRLVRMIHDEGEFEGSKAARDDAEQALRNAWPSDPMLQPEIQEKLSAWYLGLVGQALDRTPQGTRLEMLPPELTPRPQQSIPANRLFRAPPHQLAGGSAVRK